MSHNKHQATGDELKTFGSIWHVVKAAVAAVSAATQTRAAADQPDAEPVPEHVLMA